MDRTSGPTFWFARFSDLNPLDIYLCGRLKSTVYATEASDIRRLQQRKQDEFEMIRTTPGICLQFRRSPFRLATSCVRS